MLPSEDNSTQRVNFRLLGCPNQKTGYLSVHYWAEGSSGGVQIILYFSHDISAWR